jgi:ring-1,2-phenylacetyl-CoA epoxidase subunit PaaC
MNSVTAYALRLGDNGLVLSQRLGAWCGHAPELEIDLALANIGLDLLGQARNFLTYAAEREGQGDEDTLAFGRDERQFRNVLLVEQPNGSFADTIARQYLMDAWNVALYERLTQSATASLPPSPPKRLKRRATTCASAAAGWCVWATGPKRPRKKCSRPSTTCGVLRRSCLTPMTSSWR